MIYTPMAFHSLIFNDHFIILLDGRTKYITIIMNTSSSMGVQDKDDGDGDPHPDAMHHTDVDVDNVVTNQPKTVSFIFIKDKI